MCINYLYYINFTYKKYSNTWKYKDNTPNQILDKKEIAKDGNNKIDLENQYEKLSKENIQQESNNSYIFNSIIAYQQRYIELLQDISKKTLELNKNIIDVIPSLYLEILNKSSTKIYDEINQKIYNNLLALVNIFNENILKSIDKYTKTYGLYLTDFRETYQNLSDKSNYSVKD